MVILVDKKDRKEFSEETIKKAWKRSGGKCECKRKTHGHEGRCNKELIYKNRGRDDDDDWEAHHKNGDETNNNEDHCLIFCWGCHRQTMAEDSEKNKNPQRLGIKIPKK
jgi:hypothetical protein